MISSSITQINAEIFLQEGYELSLDAIVPSVELTGSFTPFQSKTQLFIYDYSHTLVYQNPDYEANGSFLPSSPGSSTTSTTSSYNKFELNPQEDVISQGYSSGMYYALYNFIDYELGSELSIDSITPADEKNPVDVTNYGGHPYFISEISGDRTELRIQNNFLSPTQIENYYKDFINKISARENADEFYISFDNNRNFIAVNSQLKSTPPDSTDPTSILIKLYKPLPPEFVVEQQLQIISKAGETQVFAIDFKPNLQFVDNLLSLKGPNYNIDLKDKINNSTNKKNLSDLVNTASSQSYYQFNNLNNQKGVILRKDWSDWSQFVKYSSAEQRLNNFKDKMTSIEGYENELSLLGTLGSNIKTTPDYSSSYNNISNNINQIISKFDSYEYFLYYITGSESWPKYTSTYPYTNYSVTSSAISNWFGSTDETSPFYNSGKNQIYSASIYDENNQDYLYYLIPAFITDNSSNDRYTQFVNMTGQAFDEMYLYTEAVEQVRNTNSSLTGDVLPLGLADEAIESLGFETYGNNFNSIGFNPNQIGVKPPAGSGLEYITRYIDIASGSVVNYYDKQESTLGYVIALADPSFPYPIDNAAQEIYKRIFHNMVSLVKRKGTVTGLRQLINIWGVPSTMLRISEFGGKNKDDENDYDLWMNRYSTALTTYDYQSGNPDGIPSASVRIPWQPLNSNFIKAPVYNNISEYIVPSCIQFRFKVDEVVTPTSNFSQSLLVKGNLKEGFADFALTLAYSGSQSGSYSGSALPNNHQYGELTFAISGSVAEGGTLVTTPISLPFFNNEWWSVQLQRLNTIPMTLHNSQAQTWELKVANNIYDGYDGNKIGFTGSADIITTGLKPSYNLAWNTNHGVTTFSPSTTDSYARGNSSIVLGGMMEILGENNQFTGATAADPTNRLNIGKGFSGSFQEFRLYDQAMSGSQFNDYVMNPESIQGHSDSNTGDGSSYDLLSFRLPLGNELEYTEVTGSANSANIPSSYGKVKQLVFGGNSAFAGNEAFGSLHPSIVNRKGSLFTGSFVNTTTNATSSQYSICWQGRTDTTPFPPDSVTSSYLAPNTEINYMDQPAAGIRNRIKNKIQVIDGNEYGKVLSPFRSIQQEFEQSSSYTEDLNSLEVGFSFENEINDDIIATFGHGVVSDAIADPRFISESNDRYPELTRIAEDYFKKYQGVSFTSPAWGGGKPTTIEKRYDYNRLIQFYETSLFKAIKNYVPARTSLSTGIIVKQHLLERNKATTVIGINPNTPMAKTPETGSDSWGYTTQTGFNSVISNKNLLITSSIGMYSLTGSAGGSINKYNIITNEGSYYYSDSSDVITAPPNVFVSLFPDTNVTTQNENSIFQAVDFNGDIYLESTVAFRSQMRFNPYLAVAPALPGVEFTIQITSSERGGIFTNTFPSQTAQNPPSLLSENYIDVYPDERLYVYIACDVLDTGGNNILIDGFSFEIGEGNNFDKPEPKVSQQVNWYRDNYTGLLKVKDTQEEFYNGEYSGSNIPTIPAQYNPYRIFADGNDKTPDTIPPPPYVDFTKGSERGTTGAFTATNANTIVIDTNGITITNDYEAFTGSFYNLQEGQEYEVSISYTSNQFNGDQSLVLGFNQMTTTSFPNNNIFQYWQGANLTGAPASAGPITNLLLIPPAFNTSTTVTSFTYNTTPGTNYNDNNGIFFYNNSTNNNKTSTITVNYIRAINTLGPKHFYERDSFTILPSQSQLFQNSPYNPIINNISGSRPNSYLFDQDFDPPTPSFIEGALARNEGIPADYTLLISSSQLGFEGANPTNDNLLEYSEVPDSNYTIKSSINPRYDGSKITSADYNFGITEISLSESKVPTGVYSPLIEIGLQKASKIKFLNGETGSWKGDSTNKFSSAIDTRPINFAHFKTSYESLEIKDSTTFEIDYLIQIPFTSIQGEQSPIITGSILNSNNENLIPVSSTFVPNRKLKAYYNQSTKQFRNFTFYLTPSLSTTTSPILNYGAEKPESKYILFPSQEIISEFTNQKSDIQVSITSSFNIPIWMASSSINYTKEIGGVDNRWDLNSTRNGFISDNNFMNTLNFPLTESIIPAPLNFNSGSITLAVTGSSPSGDREGYGLLYLQGYASQGQNIIRIIPANPNLAQELEAVSGPHLAVINSLNMNIDRGDVADVESPNYFDNNPNQNPIYCTVAQAGYPLVPTTGEIIVNPLVGPSIANYGSPLPVLPSINRAGGKGFPNYFSFNYSASALTEYQNKKIPLMIEEGDEIQVTYANIIGTPFRAVDGSPNTLGNYRYDTVNFTVLGYEQPPPTLSIPKENVYPLTDNLQSPWYPQNDGTQLPFWAIVDSLPEKGVFSPDELVNKFNVMSYNSQSLFAANTNSSLTTTWSGSVIYANVESRIGEISGSEVTAATTGSIKLYLTGSRAIASYNNEVDVILFSDTLTSRATNYGNNESGEDLINIASSQSPSKYQYAGDGASSPLDPGFLFDTLKVTPNPSTLPTPIFSGSIMSMTIKKRLDNDMRVVVDMSQPDGSKGVLTPSGDGYLIPDDLTDTQQDNVQKLINVLKSQNAFTNPPDANETSDVS